MTNDTNNVYNSCNITHNHFISEDTFAANNYHGEVPNNIKKIAKNTEISADKLTEIKDVLLNEIESSKKESKLAKRWALIGFIVGTAIGLVSLVISIVSLYK